MKKTKTPLRAAFVVTVVAAAFGAGCGTTITNPPFVCDDGNGCTCPSQSPEDGADCATAGLECDYGDPDDCPSDATHARCGEDGLWQVEPTGFTCNPPGPPPDCPESLPVNGDSCPTNFGGDTPVDCSYDVTSSCGVVQTVEPFCTLSPSGFVWQVALVDPCNGDPAQCGDNTHPDICVNDTSCRWLVPGCGEPGEAVFEAGCFAAEDCSGSCADESLSCQQVTYDPCYLQSCDACGAAAMLCLPAPE